MADSNSSNGCCSNQCGCNVARRDFLKIAAAAAVGALTPWRTVMAGPFTPEDFEALIPSDKKLDPAWVASLTERGEPAWRRGEELRYIGMPVGGVCAGQVYLGGDGRLWLWDVFNQYGAGVAGRGTSGELYVKPLDPLAPFEQGFAVRIHDGNSTYVRTLDRQGFRDVSFLGAYPVGHVQYRDDASPVTVDLEAFSPFIPLNTDDSSLPTTIMSFTVRNSSSKPIAVEIAGWMENPICVNSRTFQSGTLLNRIVRDDTATMLTCAAAPLEERRRKKEREDIVFDDFEEGPYAKWSVTGTAFGEESIVATQMPAYQGDVGAHGKRLVNTHNTRNGGSVQDGDAHIGTLVSKPFTIERKFINLLLGGGNHPGETCINLLIEGKIVRTATGRNDNKLAPHSWGVADLQGKTARLQIVDAYTGGWGNIGVDNIVFSDRSGQRSGPLQDANDFGTMALTLLAPSERSKRAVRVPDFAGAQSIFDALAKKGRTRVSTPFADKPVGAVSDTVDLAPGAEAVIRFAIAWHFPNLSLRPFKHPVGRHYAQRFASAAEVATYVTANFDRLAAETRRWRDTWYDSTLPYWFLDRTFANTSTLATSTVFRFADGRFYGWEGVGCCEGTCTHVWHYAQAVARIFPDLERDARERVDFGLSFDEATGGVGHRGEFNRRPADDGQEGTILRAYREHLMSADRAFLERNWPRIKKAVQYLIDKDGNADGIIEGPQPNTLDADWFGQVPWLVSLYIAALRAGEAMATEMNDTGFANTAKTICERGAERLVKDLYNGEYFIQKVDPAQANAVGVGTGCHIDQVLGQSWAFQVHLGRLHDEAATRSALGALFRYNFAPDVGPYKKAYPKGRPYALAGDGGLLMCTWPKGGRKEEWDVGGVTGYFNECMSGFEHQVAGHMIWEGMLQEGLAISRAIHDRYHPRLRNPYNEIECSDHYARAMASYGVFLAACGFEYHGPQGFIGFAPRLSPENFRAPFTAAEGWGTFSQRREGNATRAAIAVQWGRLRLRTIALAALSGMAPATVRATLGDKVLSPNLEFTNDRATISLGEDIVIEKGQTLSVELA